jgi:hypothetical protein
VFLDKGEGIDSKLGLQDHVFARIMTLVKACHGAILGSANLSYLVNFARSSIYTTVSRLILLLQF